MAKYVGLKNRVMLNYVQATRRVTLRTMLKSFTVLLVLAVALPLVSISVRAEGASCIGIGNPLNNCGGPSGTPAGSLCYPTVTFLDPKIDSVWSTGSGPTLQVHVRFCVGVGGSGYNLSGGDNGLSVQVYAQVAEFVIDEAGGCSETRIDTDGRCVECSKDCQFYTTSLPVGQTSGVVNFWAKASQTADGACECTSEIVAVSVTGQDPPDTIPVPLPVPEELGPIACETQVGDPINVTNGNLFLERLDVTFPSDLGFPMDFIRYYNSYDTVFTSLFRNWRHSFEYSLDSVDTQTYVLTEATGRRVKFTRTTLNNGATQIATYAPSYGVHYRLSIAGSPALYTVTREDDSKLCFQGLGKLDYMDDRMGTRTTLFYTDQLLDSVKNPSGRLLKFEYGLFGRLTGIRSGNDSLLVVYNYAPGAGGVPGAGALEKVRYQNPVETFEQYGYGTGSANQFHITQITSSDSPTRTYQYDAVGRAVQYSKASGAEQVTLAWSVNQSTCPDTIKATSTSPNGTAYHNSFWSPDYTKRMVVYTDNSDCGQCATTYSYDGGGMKQTIAYPVADGRVDSMYYDSRGNMTRRVLGATSSIKQATSISYHSSFNLPTRATTASVAKPGTSVGSIWNYDVSGNVTSVIEGGWLNSVDSVTYTTSFTNNVKGQPINIDGPRTDVADTVGFYYDPLTFDLDSVKLANGDRYIYGDRTSLGRPTTVTGPNGDVTKFGFDVRGRLVLITRLFGTADSASTKYTYNVDGDLTSITDPLGHVTAIHRDAAGNVDKITDPLNNYIQNSFDLAGNRRSTGIYAANNVLRAWTNYGYDTKYRVIADTNAYGAHGHYGYSTAGLLTSYINERSFETKYRYDTLHRLTATVQMYPPDSARARYEYDSHNNVKKVIDPDGWVNVSYYDDFDRAVRDSSGATTINTFKYDPAGNLTNWKNQTDGITYTYDALNRLTKKRANTTDSVTYQYDGTEYPYGKGLLYKVVNRTSTTKYRYDLSGRLFKEYRQFSGTATWDSTAYTYDKNDNISVISYPTGRQVKYTRNAASQVTKVEVDVGSGWMTVANNISYAPFGQASSWTFANGVNVAIGVDSAYRTRSISTYPDTLARFAYVFDAAGNITLSLDSVGGFDTLRYTYDGLDRVKSSSSKRFGDTLQQYTYTPNGNITKMKRYHPAIDSIMLSYSANRLGGTSGADVNNYLSDRFGNISRQVHGTQSGPPPGGARILGPSGPDTTYYYHSLWGTFDSIRYRATVSSRYYYTTTMAQVSG